MNKPHYHGHRQRLRERLAKSSTALADYELLELLLAQTLPRKDTKPLAKELLARFGSLRSVLYAPPAQLAEVKGLGPATLTGWNLLRELWARMQEEKLSAKEIFRDAQTVADAARARFGSAGTEQTWAALLDSRNRLLKWDKLSGGSTDEASIRPQQVVTIAVKNDAHALILVHNHPGGDAWPSEEDKIFTLQLAKTAAGVGIALHDHVIVTELDYYSFQENNLL